MFKVVIESEGFGRERLKYNTLAEVLAIELLYHECQENPDSIERLIGLVVNDQSDPDDEWVCPACGDNWFSGEPELIFAPGGVPYCPACDEVIMQRT